ncbi:MAG TPA: IPT/TIG domain-containing protein, partial [Acidimicrobiales bacterium]
WEPGPGRNDPSRRRERWLVVAVAVVAALVVAAGIALAASQGKSGPQVAAPPTSSPSTTHPSTHHAAAPRHSGHQGSSGSSNTSTTAPAAPAVAGGPPVISSITPSSGAAGQGIQVAGANFLSSNGQITATFNGQVAPTSCPAQNTCTVTVPPSTGATSAQIVITTASGTSNAVTFNYS